MKQSHIGFLFGGFLFLFTSCISPPKPPSDDEITRLARKEVLKELYWLDQPSIFQIQSSQPEINWKTVDWYLDYEILWRLTNSRTVVVTGPWSNREKLKYSRIQVRQGTQ